MSSLKSEWKIITSGKFIYLILIVPILVAAVFGFIFSNNVVNEAPIAVVDQDQSAYSLQLIEKLDASQYIRVEHIFHQPIEPDHLFYNEKYLAAVYFPKGMETSRFQGKQTNIGFYVDVTLPSAVSGIRSGVSEVIATENSSNAIGKLSAMGLNNTQATSMLTGLSLQQQTLYNPTNDAMNIGVIGFVNTIFISLISASTIVIVPRLRKEGLLQKELNQSALGVVMRVVPYALIGCIGLYFCLAALKFFGTLRFAAHPIEVLLPLFLFTLNAALFAVLLGWTASEPAKASSRTMLVVILSFLLAGFQVPTLMLPKVLQWLGNLLPITHHFKFIRGMGMRGGDLQYFMAEIGSYFIMTAVLVLIVSLLSWKELRASKKEDANQEHQVPMNLTSSANSQTL